MTLPICAGCESRTDPADLNGPDHCPSCASWEREQCGRLDCSSRRRASATETDRQGEVAKRC